MKVIIDGNNVLCYGSDRTDGKVQCYPINIDAMFSALDAKGIEWFCFFDANCVKRVSETCSREDVDLFLGLLNKNAQQINVIPGGTRADMWILQKASRENLKIVTNDHYRDQEYVAKFPWLAQERANRANNPGGCRLLPFLVAEGMLQVFDLDICWDLKTGSEVRRASKPEQRKVQHDSGMLRTADLPKLYGATADESRHRAAKEAFMAMVDNVRRREQSDNPLSDDEVEQFRKEAKKYMGSSRVDPCEALGVQELLNRIECRRNPPGFTKLLTKKTWLDKLLGGEL